MSITEGYAIGKDLMTGIENRKYQAGLQAIKTPQERAAERADQSAQDQSTLRIAQQYTPGSDQQVRPPSGAAEIVRNVGVMPQPKIAPAPAPDATPNLNDQIGYLNESAQYAAKHGKLDPMDLVKLQTTVGNMKAEGLDKAISLMNKGDVAGGLSAYNAVGGHRVKLIDSQDGNTDIGGVKVPTKLVTIEDENGQRETIDTAHFLNASSGITDVIKQQQKGAEITETNRHNVSREGIDRENAKNSGGSDKATAEMKNAAAFFPNDTPAEGLKKFRQLMTKEGGLTQSADGMGGMNVIDHRTNEIYHLDSDGNKTVMKPAEVNGAPPPIAAPTKKPPASIDWSKY